jgi:hypothetical protein
MDPSAEIREQARRLLNREIPVAEFWSWLQPKMWDIDRVDRSAASLAHQIELLLTETAHGDWTEDELRDKLRELLFADDPRSVRATR